VSDQQSGDEVRYIAAALRRLERIADAIELDRNSSQQVNDWLHEVSAELLNQLTALNRSLALLAVQNKEPVDGQNEEERSTIRSATAELRSNVIDYQVASLKEQLRIQYSNLAAEQKQAANYGADPPLHLRNSIDGIREEIDRLEDQLKTFKSL